MSSSVVVYHNSQDFERGSFQEVQEDGQGTRSPQRQPLLPPGRAGGTADCRPGPDPGTGGPGRGLPPGGGEGQDHRDRRRGDRAVCPGPARRPGPEPRPGRGRRPHRAEDHRGPQKNRGPPDLVRGQGARHHHRGLSGQDRGGDLRGFQLLAQGQAYPLRLLPLRCAGDGPRRRLRQVPNRGAPLLSVLPQRRGDPAAGLAAGPRLRLSYPGQPSHPGGGAALSPPLHPRQPGDRLSGYRPQIPQSAPLPPAPAGGVRHRPGGPGSERADAPARLLHRLSRPGAQMRPAHRPVPGQDHPPDPGGDRRSRHLRHCAQASGGADGSKNSATSAKR